MNIINLIASILLIIGGLNWGLVGIANFDLVATIFGAGSSVARIVYVLVGLAALWSIVQWTSYCGTCSTGRSKDQM